MERITFEELKPILKDKWLDYYEANQWIIDKVIEEGYVCGNRHVRELRPQFILGTVTVLEPRLKEFLSKFFLVCDSWHRIVEVLGLNFNLKLELEKRNKQNCTHEQHDMAVSEVA